MQVVQIVLLHRAFHSFVGFWSNCQVAQTQVTHFRRFCPRPFILRANFHGFFLSLTSKLKAVLHHKQQHLKFICFLHHWSESYYYHSLIYFPRQLENSPRSSPQNQIRITNIKKSHTQNGKSKLLSKDSNKWIWFQRLGGLLFPVPQDVLHTMSGFTILHQTALKYIWT